MPDKAQCVDDTCEWSNNTEEAFWKSCAYLQRCGQNGVILNPKKFNFAEDVVEFCGFEIGTDYVRPCKKFHMAIENLERPLTLTDVRSFF